MKIAGIVAGVLALYAAGYAIAGWWLMLVLGAVHLDVFTWVPALGWWQSILVVALASALGGAWNSSAAISRSRNK